MPDRVRFFSGQSLSATDFETEQTYFIEKLRLHNRMLHGIGVVRGLDVTPDPNDANGIIVSSGFALDPFGNQILVAAQVRVKIGACKTDACFLTLYYAEAPTHPIPVANGKVESSRITEGFSILTAQTDNAQGVILARLICQSDQFVIDRSYVRKSV